MSRPMSWAECSAEADRLRADREAGGDVLEAASALVDRLRVLALASPPPAPPPAHACPASSRIEEHLRVGPISLPDGAPGGLVALVHGFDDRRIGPGIVAEFVAATDAFVASARRAAAELAGAEAEADEAGRVLRLMAAYARALDALAEPPEGGPAGPGETPPGPSAQPDPASPEESPEHPTDIGASYHPSEPRS